MSKIPEIEGDRKEYWRWLFAAFALAGNLANPETGSINEVVHSSITAADHLLNYLLGGQSNESN